MSGPDGSSDEGGTDDDVGTSHGDGWADTVPDRLRAAWGSNSEGVSIARDIAISVGVVLLIGLILFAVSGVWPPLVAIESGSMEPNMHRGDLVFLVDHERFASDEAIGGITPVAVADEHEKFGEEGDVIIFFPNGNQAQTPVIHRAHYWVEEGENWVDGQADPDHLNGATCDDVPTCPARHDGFITKGDANPTYDQHEGGADTDVVRDEWLTGKAMWRVPWLGYIRLTVDEILGVVVVGASLGAVSLVRRAV